MTTVNPVSAERSQPTRRERAHAAAQAEILQAARRLLIEGGAERVTVRGIATEVGITAPGLYRYFSGREALLGELCSSLYDELADVLYEARDRDPDAPLKQRFLVTSFAFRKWALEHRPEFGLLFGAPIPGVLVDIHIDPDPAANRGMRFGQVWLELFAELWRQHPVPVPDADELDPRLREQLTEYHEQIGRIVPLGAVVLYLSCWIQLYGAVATEAFGHLNFALHDGDAEALFHDLMGELAAKLGLTH
ncbi:MAG TPA: TetR/AcrR family transcriptional regulator [Jatrophihabitantaceae bacterium]